MGKTFEQYVTAWNLMRARDIHLPAGEKRTRKPKPAPEPPETMEAAGLRIVLDAAPVKLKKVDYPG